MCTTAAYTLANPKDAYKPIRKPRLILKNEHIITILAENAPGILLGLLDP
jgi:hypothetical protein